MRRRRRESRRTRGRAAGCRGVVGRGRCSTRLTRELDFGPGQARPRLQAELRWSSAAGRGHDFGVSFTGGSGEERELLAATLDEFRRRAALLQ